jgi:hypothetical protein
MAGKRQRQSAGQRARPAQSQSAVGLACLSFSQLRAEATRLAAREVHEHELHFMYTTYRGMCERGAWLVRSPKP